MYSIGIHSESFNTIIYVFIFKLKYYLLIMYITLFKEEKTV